MVFTSDSSDYQRTDLELSSFEVYDRKFYCTVRLTVLEGVLGYCTVRPLEALGASDGWLYPSDGWGYSSLLARYFLSHRQAARGARFYFP